jgi:hypothetical protein
MPLEGFELVIAVSERSLTHTLDGAATVIVYVAVNSEEFIGTTEYLTL